MSNTIDLNRAICTIKSTLNQCMPNTHCSLQIKTEDEVGGALNVKTIKLETAEKVCKTLKNSLNRNFSDLYFEINSLHSCSCSESKIKILARMKKLLLLTASDDELTQYNLRIVGDKKDSKIQSSFEKLKDQRKKLIEIRRKE